MTTNRDIDLAAIRGALKTTDGMYVSTFFDRDGKLMVFYQYREEPELGRCFLSVEGLKGSPVPIAPVMSHMGGFNYHVGHADDGSHLIFLPDPADVKWLEACFMLVEAWQAEQPSNVVPLHGEPDGN